jgi:catechol 2,3-dioxygenase-like lactoylglutathione lyase family enzyme
MAQFRFCYFTLEYEKTLAFYRDGLGLPLVDSWDRSPDDRGSLFAAASGLIEVIVRPTGPSSHLWDERPPQGASMVIEVPDVDAVHRRALDRGLPVTQAPTNQSWGHRSFCVREPNGLTIYFFSELSGHFA